MDRTRLEALVREVLARHLGSAAPPSSVPVAGAPAGCKCGGGHLCGASTALDFVSEREVLAARDTGAITVTQAAIITDLAREMAKQHGVRFTVGASGVTASAPNPAASPVTFSAAPVAASADERGVVALGADHGGVVMKDALRDYLESEGWTPLDFGTHGSGSVDYPDYAHKVAGAVARGEARFGIIVDGVGVGSCMAANRHRGVRAALGAGILEVTNAREHNDANVLCLGGRTMGDLQARAMTTVFLTTPHAGGRHARRVAKIELS